ncbi:MAG TPA: penicillin acylase family protein, partial [Acidobacteria bacterium]|nr:penicillin acylase family protein [Acidobacteriota bacterium]
MAKDRLWQMETYRRTARGTLAEILGKDYLQDDIFMRTAGYSETELQQAYDSLDTESKTVLRAYVAGINRRIAEIHQDPTQLPFEFRAIGGQLGVEFFPADWTVTDVMSWLVALLRNFDPEGRGVTGQLDNAVLLQTFAQVYPNDYLAMFSDLRWRNDPAALTYIHDEKEEASNPIPKVTASSMPDLRAAATRIKSRHDRRIVDLKRINAFTKMGSYAWVVSGEKTASGRPTIYSGPQMGFSVPSIVMEGSIRGAGLNISGMTVPGVPGIIIGRTPHHAWSMQVGHAHTLDFYLEAPQSVKLNRMETFHVAGGADVTVPIFRTSHGPVIEPIPYDPSNPPAVIVSFKYSEWGYELKDVIQFALQAARATDMKEFGKALDLAPLSQHFCYADKDGNIAYWMSGRDPVRPANVDVRFPLPGDGTAEWDPKVAKPHPHDENTPYNYYGGWNNKAEASYDNPPNNLWYTMGVFHRAHVVDDYLSTHDNLTYEQVRDLALNIATTDSFYGGGNPWKFVASRFESAVAANPSDERNAAIALL